MGPPSLLWHPHRLHRHPQRGGAYVHAGIEPPGLICGSCWSMWGFHVQCTIYNSFTTPMFIILP